MGVALRFCRTDAGRRCSRHCQHTLPYVEEVILLSVPILGVLIAGAFRFSMAAKFAGSILPAKCAASLVLMPPNQAAFRHYRLRRDSERTHHQRLITRFTSGHRVVAVEYTKGDVFV